MPKGEQRNAGELDLSLFELFFDLVFVFAVSQLSTHLYSRLTWAGAAETLIMLRASFAIWYGTTWAATGIRERKARPGLMILAVAFLSLFMNAAITNAFATHSYAAWVLVILYLFLQIGRTLWVIAFAPNTVAREHFVRTLAWFALTAPLWIFGAAYGPETRLILWAIAAGVDIGGSWLAHPVPGRRLHSDNVPFDAGHIIERCGTFLMIVIGETVFTTGTALAAAPLNWTIIVTGAVAFILILALWSLCFGSTRAFLQHHLRRTTNPIRVSRYAINALMVMVAGLIPIAVANRMIITAPNGEMGLTVALLLGGGPMIFLLAQGWYTWALRNTWPILHMLGGVAVMWVALLTMYASGYAGLVSVGGCLLVLAVLDQKAAFLFRRKTAKVEGRTQ